MNWDDLLPHLAVAQRRWERRHAARRMREAGLTFREMGIRLNLSHSRTRQLYWEAMRLHHPIYQSPVERHLAAHDFNDFPEVKRRRDKQYREREERWRKFIRALVEHRDKAKPGASNEHTRSSE